MEPMDKLPLSALIPTKNETRNVADCLASVARRYDWARIGPRLAEVYIRFAKPAAACGETSRAAAHAPSER